MTKSNLIGALVIFSVFGGPLSCAPDKLTSERPDDPAVVIKDVEDPWSVQAPTVEGEGKGQMLTEDLGIPAVVTANAKIVFPSLQTADFQKDPIDIQIKGDCFRQPNLNYSINLSFKNLSSIALRDLLPREAFALSTSAVPLHCALEFVFRNQIGSRHRHATHRFEVQNLAAATGLGIFQEGVAYDDPTQATRPLFVSRLNLTKLTGLPGGPGEALLECQTFQIRQKLQDLAQLDFQRLAHAPVTASPTARDERVQTPWQNCRLYIFWTHSIDRMLATRIFELRYELAPLQISYQVLPLKEVRTWPGEHALLDIQIHNPHNGRITLALDRIRPQMQLQGIYYTPSQNKLFYTQPFDANLRFSFAGFEWVQDIGAHTFLQIEPSSSAHIRIHFNSSLECFPHMNDLTLMGFRHALSQNLLIHRTGQASVTTPFTLDLSVVAVPGFSAAPQPLLENWLPLPVTRDTRGYPVYHPGWFVLLEPTPRAGGGKMMCH